MNHDENGNEIYDLQVALNVPKKPRDKKEISEVRRWAGNVIQKYDLCNCSADDRHYLTKRQADSDQKPVDICAKCGKLKLRINFIENPPVRDRMVLVVSWKTAPASPKES